MTTSAHGGGTGTTTVNQAKNAAIPPEAAAFLRAICESPQDDTVRLVYADWLEEHGQGQDAILLRLAGRYEIHPPEASNGTGWRLYWCPPGRSAARLACDLLRPGQCPVPTCSTGWRVNLFIFGGWMCYGCAAREAKRTVAA